MCLVHVIVLRVFVETVLRYGLPLDFVAVLIKVCLGSPCRSLLLTKTNQTDSKREKKVRSGLDSEYAYLAGNAFGKDSKGRPKKDEGVSQTDMMAGGDQGEYSAYVCYDIDVN